MSVFVAKFDYFKKDVKTREYQVDDDFLEFLHMMKDNGSNQYDTIVHKVTDPIVNSFSKDAGVGWTHSNGILFGMGRSKEAAINHLIKHAEDEGQMDEEEMGWLKDAVASSSKPAEDPMSPEDKNKLRGHAGIERK